MTLAQVWCRLTGGHITVMKSGRGLRRERCYVCDAPIGAGWDFRMPAVRPARPRGVWTVVARVLGRKVA